MDTLTHVAIGACIGAAFGLRRQQGQLMVVGSVAQVLPDFDVVTNLWLSPEEALVAHRGFTHSFLFALIFSLVFSSWLSLSNTFGRSAGFWLVFLLVELLVHDLLDTFNAYGTALLIPFSFERISFHSLYVVDPVFSVVPGLAVVLLIAFRGKIPIRVLTLSFTFLWCFIYLLLSLWVKEFIDAKVGESKLFREGARVKTYFSTPMPFTILNWYLVAEGEYGFYVGYRSVFEKVKDTEFRFYDRADSLLRPFETKPEVNLLKRFSGGYYTISVVQDTVVFNVLRFGRHQDTEGEFVLRYFLNDGLNNHGRLIKGRTKID